MCVFFNLKFSDVSKGSLLFANFRTFGGCLLLLFMMEKQERPEMLHERHNLGSPQ